MTAATAINAFSAMALWIVPMLFVAGVALAALLLPDLATLRTTYGQLLIVKVAGFVLLMGLAALNKWRLGPPIATGDVRVASVFRGSLKAEYVLIAGVLSVTAVLTSLYSPD
jgi:putative copper export protein